MTTIIDDFLALVADEKRAGDVPAQFAVLNNALKDNYRNYLKVLELNLNQKPINLDKTGTLLELIHKTDNTLSSVITALGQFRQKHGLFFMTR
jgi:hypothetical protein